jgi:hypothetical protein
MTENLRIKEVTMSRSLLCVSSVTILLISLIFSPAIAQQSDIRTEPIHFKTGALSAVVQGSITGHEIVDYVLGAGKGQYMNVSMATDNEANYFNILAPGENEVAFVNGSVSDNQYEGILPKKGEYKIRVYLMRSAARLNETANYNLEIIFTNADDTKRTSPSGPSKNDAAIHGTKYNATEKIPCSVAKDQPTGSCPFSVTREGKGNGIVTITKPDGSTRTIFFENGKAVGADVSQAVPGEFSAKKEGDMNVIRIGDEHYQIPEAVIPGG